MIFGIAKIVHSDNSAALRSKLVELMAAKIGVQITHSLPHHSQGNQPTSPEKYSEIPKSATGIYIRHTDRLGATSELCTLNFVSFLFCDWEMPAPQWGWTTRLSAYLLYIGLRPSRHTLLSVCFTPATCEFWPLRSMVCSRGDYVRKWNSPTQHKQHNPMNTTAQHNTVLNVIFSIIWNILLFNCYRCNSNKIVSLFFIQSTR